MAIFDLGTVKDYVEISVETERKKAEVLIQEEREKMNEEIQERIKSHGDIVKDLDALFQDSIDIILRLFMNIPRPDRANIISATEKSMEGSYSSYAVIIFNFLKRRHYLMDIPSPRERKMNVLAMYLTAPPTTQSPTTEPPTSETETGTPSKPSEE